jgi:hypothetical protein
MIKRIKASTSWAYIGEELPIRSIYEFKLVRTGHPITDVFK